MRLLRKPERWMCLPASFAMALDVPLEDIFKEIGHDGSNVAWPHLPEPVCRRGFHPQELVHVCLNRGYAATLVELCPVLRTLPEGPETRHPLPGQWQLDSLHANHQPQPRCSCRQRSSLWSRGRLRVRPHLRPGRVRVRLLARSL